MMIFVFLLTAAAAFIAASRLYGAYVARAVGEDPQRPTPATTCNDGRDYVPSRRYVVFAHHFSAIAGAGPILGPTMAVLYGFVPAWLWVVFGGIFIGAVHDFTALFVSIREGGKSMAEVARKTMGATAFSLFIVFALLMMVLVTSSFLSSVVMSLTSLWPVDKLGLGAEQTLLHTQVDANGTVLARIGGIASTSVIIITLFSPILGWLIYRRNASAWIAYPLASIVCAASVVAGIYYPIVLGGTAWMILISIYVLFAAGVPVWVILQPRDFINVQILYAGIALMVVSIVSAGSSGVEFSMPAFNLSEGVKSLGFIWPMMFITIACGAVSGFHSLVAGGTTGKQIASEGDARRIGFNAMLLESLLAVCVLLALGVGLTFVDYKSLVWPTDPGARGNPILAFSLAAGHLFQQGTGIPMALGTVLGILLVEGFVITTLDAAVRLNRYLFEELWTILFKNPPAFLKNYWFNALLCVGIMWLLAYRNAFQTLWPIFGAANQLLAALGLLTVSVWLMLRGRKSLFALIPAAFMIVTTLASLLVLLPKYWSQGKAALVTMDLLLIVLSICLVVSAARRVLGGVPVQERLADSSSGVSSSK